MNRAKRATTWHSRWFSIFKYMTIRWPPRSKASLSKSTVQIRSSSSRRYIRRPCLSIKYTHQRQTSKYTSKVSAILSVFRRLSFARVAEILHFSIRSVKVCKMVAQGFTVDLTKALVFQVGHLGEDYEEWVHQPIATKEGPRFFQSDFWEFLTLTVWWAVPVIWLPVVVWCISMSVSMGCSVPEIVSVVVMGIFIWTFVEYFLHRFVFHIKTKSYWGNTAHYLIHGCHHKHPMDHLRLVFPPAATAILCIPFWNIAKAISTPSTAPALFGGGMLGYVMYDVTHYYLHHAQPTRPVTKNLKKYHLNHHFRIQDKGFGITSSLWDIVFGTLPTTKAPKKQQ